MKKSTITTCLLALIFISIFMLFSGIDSKGSSGKKEQKISYASDLQASPTSGSLSKKIASPIVLTKHLTAKHKNWDGFNGHSLRNRPINLSPAIIGSEPLQIGQELKLELFDDVTLEAEVTDSFVNVNQTVTTTAQIKGSIWGRIFIACTDGKVQAKIIHPEEDKIYAIHYNQSSQAYYALEIDPATEQFDEPELGPTQLADTFPESNELITPEAVVRADESNDATVVIDVMVVYSDGALARAGSASNVNNLIALGMAFGNDAHTNTNTGIKLILVHSQHVVYTDSDSRSIDLKHITNLTDEVLDEVPTLRDEHSADFVAMLVGDYTADGGLASLLTTTDGNADTAYSITTYPAFDTYTPVHEIGHNMGLHHAIEQDISWGPTNWGTDNLGFGYCAAGWHWHPTPEAKGYCSLMSYTTGSNYDGVDDDGNPSTNPNAETDGLSHTRVGVFSDPNITHRGEATGDTLYGNNAKVLRALKSIYAAYRTKSTPANSIAISSPAVGESWTVGATQQIQWNSQDVVGEVKIELIQNNAVVHVITTSTLNDRTFSWTIPVTVAEGNDYKVRISNLDDSILAESDSNFTINKAFYDEPLNSDPGYTLIGGLPEDPIGKWEFGEIKGEYHLPVTAPSGINIYATDLDNHYYEDGDSIHQTANDVRLISIPIDCTDYNSCRLKFQRVLSLSSGDIAKVEVSNDNAIWHPLYSSLGDYFYTQDWSLMDYDIASYADGQNTVYIRWSIETNSNSKALSGWGIDDIQLVGLHNTTANNPPSVDAGENQTILSSVTATLAASVSDDSLPSPVSLLWSKLEGPGEVTFNDAVVANTTATFSQAGTYVLKLSVTDTQFTTEDVVVITAKNPQSITFGSIPTKTYGDGTFTLNATSDSGLPITYVTTDSSVATIDGNVVTIVGPGTVEIIAIQDGDVDFIAANQVRQTLTVYLAYNLQEGWNLIALPCSNMDITNLLSTTSTSLWSWDGNSYQATPTPNPLQGFWIHCDQTETVNLTGNPSINTVVTMSAGWNIYGPSRNMKALDCTTYSWANDLYSLITPTTGDLLIGTGYWFYSNQTESIDLQ